MGTASGALDIVGDVHGCVDELRLLLARLGYPQRQRRLVFVGDLVNRGPDPAGALRLVMDLCVAGAADCVLGNHDDQVRWALHGRDVEPTPELQQTLAQLGREASDFSLRVRDFFDARPAHVKLDDGKLVVAHAGLPAALHGSTSSEAFEFAVYGPSTGHKDRYGFPERIKPTPTDWAELYAAEALVVHGHKAIDAPRWIGRTLNIDTNCSRGGALTAFRYPESEFVSIPARAAYWTAQSA
jgi:calcineurin-like phosphoesterase family protein/diguanylate cyclase with GGDEF domain